MYTFERNSCNLFSQQASRQFLSRKGKLFQRETEILKHCKDFKLLASKWRPHPSDLNVTRNGTGNEKTHEKWKPKTEIHYPFLVLFHFFLFSTTRARFPFPDPRSPFLVICEIILLLNTEAEPWEYKNYPGNIIVAGMARRKSLQTPLNVKGSRITHILGTAEPLTHKRYKNGPWIQDPARVLMAIFWGQRERSSTSPPNGRANTPLMFVRKSVPGVN